MTLSQRIIRQIEAVGTELDGKPNLLTVNRAAHVQLIEEACSSDRSILTYMADDVHALNGFTVRGLFGTIRGKVVPHQRADFLVQPPEV